MPRSIVAALCLASLTLAQQPDLAKELGAELERHRVACRAPGLVAAVQFGDQSPIAVAAGARELGDDVLMLADDRLFCGSIGKTWFAAVTLKLIADGKLSLDDKAADHLADQPWLKRLPNHDTIRVRNLLRHDSGLPRWIEMEGALAEMAKPDRSWKNGEQLEFVFDQPAQHPAGEGWAYSDTNYIVLGLIVEHVTERPIYELVQEQLLDRHGLRATLPGNRREISGLTQGHVRLFRRYGFPERSLKDGKLVFDPSSEWCGGGFVTSASDLARWGRICFSPAARARDAVPARQLGKGTRYGFGVMLRDTELGPTRGHDGVFIGYSATVLWFERHDISVAVLANTDSALRRLVPAAVALAKVAVDARQGGKRR